jgi:hypothetical protein
MQLIDIQKLQFSNKDAAEAQLLEFLKANEDPSISYVELRPKPESLNSLNGFISYSDGERLFFKTHVEENEQLSEYYNATMLAKAGYPVVSAKQISHRPGKQIVLYEILSYPTLFDLLKEEEDAQLSGAVESDRARALLAAQARLESTVYSIYRDTLQKRGDSAAEPPIYQLFYHRLNENGRFGLFYKGKSIPFNNDSLEFDKLAQMHWTINGVKYSDTIAEMVQRSLSVLRPANELAVVGHGDAHNGNIFVDEDTMSLNMFDPAFAGLHDPILDLTKPLFHNIFARWMYFPEQVKNEFQIEAKIVGNEIIVEHNYFPSKLRLAHLAVKKTNLLIPTRSLLRELSKGAGDKFDNHWREYLHASLFCCPFLTVNLFAPAVSNGTLSERYGLSIKLLGLATAVALGSLSHSGDNELTEITDDIF